MEMVLPYTNRQGTAGTPEEFYEEALTYVDDDRAREWIASFRDDYVRAARGHMRLGLQPDSLGRIMAQAYEGVVAKRQR